MTIPYKSATTLYDPWSMHCSNIYNNGTKQCNHVHRN